MMSKSSFWADCRENLKRRNWTVLLCAIALFLALPVRLTMQVSVEQRHIAENPSWLETMTRREWLGNSFMQMSSDVLLVILIFALAVLLAVQGFSWMDSRRKLDLYLSVPVSSRRRFTVIYMNGAGIFAVCYLASFLLALAAGTVMGAMSGEAFLYTLVMFLCNLLFFMACYNLTLVAVMLTGNVLVTLLAAAVLFFYEYMLRCLFDGLRSSFFVTYCGLSDASGTAFSSPVVSYLAAGSGLFDYFSGYGGRYLASFGRALVLLAVQMAVYGLLAWGLYRKRKAEAAGSAVAFAWIRTPVKLLLMIPLTLLSGLWFWQLSDRSFPFAGIGMAIGLFLSHGLIQVMYEFDVRSVLKSKWHLAAAGAVSAAIFVAFSLDLTGYDSYIPEQGQIESVGIAFRNDNYDFGFYENLFGQDMYHGDPEEYMLKYMRSEDADTIAAVRELAARSEAEREKDAGRSAAGVRYSAEDGSSPVSIRYSLKDGRQIYRTFPTDLEECVKEFDVIFADADFQTARYQICGPEVREKSGELLISYGNGMNEVSYLADADELLEAYGRDLSKYSCSLMLDSLPVGKLSFAWKKPGTEEVRCVWEYPVYEKFTETTELLKEQGVYMELTEDGGFLSPEQIAGVSITCYNLNADAVEYDSDGSRAVTYSADRQITQTYTEKEQIARILPALYPQGLSGVAGGDITGKLWNDNYEASVIFRPEEHFSEGMPYFVVLEERLPEFVVEQTRYAMEG
ncbi:MAG TPA: hypothetical protein H9717_02685 [Candidatus Eisenbergiella merdipullorum]|uniref:DUF6449 domain-containing protein n=1 Tax=Candidatus Eisenbergiella merdipullorum TaxID=2838553 RepID=A0A9D2I543_9FIRM|nr:hypothetical protein [Candidatus Eisenbergiella merdipullorum]